MTNTTFADWQIKENTPGIFVAGESASQFLVIGISLLLISFLLFLIFAYYLWRFSKVKTETKIVNKPLIGVSLALPIVAMIFGIILLVFWQTPSTIFGIDGGDNLFAAYISVAIIGFLFLIVSLLLMWFLLPKYAIGLTKNQIVFIGEYIPISKITKIIKDNETGNLYINYLTGKRSLKKQKFSTTSVFGQFLLANADLLQHDVEENSQEAYAESFATTEEVLDVETVSPEIITEEVIVEEKVKEKPKTAAKPKSTADKAKPKTAAKKPAAKKATATKTTTTKKTTTAKKSSTATKPAAKKSTSTTKKTTVKKTTK